MPLARTTDDARLLELVGELQGVLDLEEFQSVLLDALRRMLPSDYVSVNGVGPAPSDTWSATLPMVPSDLHATFAAYIHQNPLVERFLRTQDGRAYRFSDLITREALHATDLYRQLYARLGVEHQIAVTLPSRAGQLLGVALSRRSHDFTDAERDLLNRARPYLIQAYRNVQAFMDLRAQHTPANAAERLQVAGLTPREVEVVQLVARGFSDQAIAETLAVSVRTVQKHLERAFRKLDVRTRSQAAAVVWHTQ